MKICMAGAYGRMGRRIIELAAEEDDIEIGGAFDAPSVAGSQVIAGSATPHPQVVVMADDPAAQVANADVLIDFTVAEACVDNVRLAAEAGKPSVVGTTGLSDGQQAELAALAERVAIVYAPNMSVGVNLLFKLTSEVAAILGLEYNVEITEIHHSLKKDSPSGPSIRPPSVQTSPAREMPGATAIRIITVRVRITHPLRAGPDPRKYRRRPGRGAADW